VELQELQLQSSVSLFSIVQNFKTLHMESSCSFIEVKTVVLKVCVDYSVCGGQRGNV
jgi:hypothetical protein